MQANCYVMNNIMLVIRSRLFLLGNKKAALAAIKNRPEAAIRGFNCYCSSLLSTLPSSFAGVMSRMYKVLLDFVSLLKILTSTFVFS